MITRSLSSAFAVLLIVAAGCSSTEPMPGGTQATLTASPPTAVAGSAESLTIAAQNPERLLKSARIDFEGDGTWDDVQFFTSHAISATFSHVYASAGSITVKAEVKDEDDATTRRSLLLIVEDSANVPVSIAVHGASGVTGGSCFVLGPPFLGTGIRQAIPDPGSTHVLDVLPHGTPVSVNQAFEQNDLAEGSATTHYGCDFQLDLLAGPAGSEVVIAHGACSTTSIGPPQLTCAIGAAGTVP